MLRSAIGAKQQPLRSVSRLCIPIRSRFGHRQLPEEPTAAQKQELLLNLKATLIAYPNAAEQLSVLLSSNTTANLTHALSVFNVKKLGSTQSKSAATVSVTDLQFVALQVSLPFIGFGFVDNAIMIIAGDYIDLTLGVSLGISSMAAAGIGNTISDIAGLGLGGVIEGFFARLGLATPSLSPAQVSPFYFFSV